MATPVIRKAAEADIPRLLPLSGIVFGEADPRLC